MQAIKCEVCGSGEFTKADGMFKCDYCGTKYTNEEVKKIIISGNVDVSGSTIKIDKSAELKNLYILARRAKKENDYDNAEKYYKDILLKEPDNWEPYFYDIYFSSVKCKDAEKVPLQFSRLKNSIDRVFKSIKNGAETENDYIGIIREISDNIILAVDKLCNAARVYHYDKEKDSGYYTLDDDTKKTAQNILYYLGDKVEEYFGDVKELNDISVNAWKKGIEKYQNYLFILANKDKKRQEYINKIRKYDESYKTDDGGCYVATAVYGSYDCPEVWTLRRWRDNTLSMTWYGRAFIHTYYAVSPTLVKWFGKKEWFRKMWKPKLDRMVRNLNIKGVENTPYKDKIW